MILKVPMIKYRDIIFPFEYQPSLFQAMHRD